MKKKISLISVLGGFAILLAGALLISSCEGPADQQELTELTEQMEQMEQTE